MSQNSYFTQLRQEFQNDPYRDRFLAELQNHAEDLAEAENLSPKSLNLNFMQKHFGDPKQVKKEFDKNLRPWKKWLEIAQVLSWGGSMILVLLFLPVLMNFLNQVFLYFSINLSFLTPLQIFLACISLWVSYLFLWGFLFKKPYLYLSRKTLILFGLTPQILVFLFSVWSLYRNRRLFGDMGSTDYYLTLALMAILMGILAFWWVSKKSPIAPKKERVKPLNLYKFFGFLGFLYIFSHSLFRLLNPFFDLKPYMNPMKTPWWELFFQPASYIDQVLLVDFPARFFIASLWVHYFQIVLVLGIFGAAVAYFFIKKRFSWLAMAALVYSLALLFVPRPELFYQKTYPSRPLEFKVPHSQVSEAIEKAQYGPFYNMVKHLEYFSPDQNRYLLQSQGDQFFLRQYDVSGRVRKQDRISLELTKGKDFLFDAKEKTFERIEKFDFRIPSLSYGIPSMEWSSSLRCEHAQSDLSQDDFEGWKICQSLLFHGQEILSQKDGDFLVDNLAFSSDEKWLMISLRESGVYFLDLSSLQS